MENTMHMYNRCPRCKKELGVYRYGFAPTFCSEYCSASFNKHKFDHLKKDVDKMSDNQNITIILPFETVKHWAEKIWYPILNEEDQDIIKACATVFGYDTE